MVMSKIEREILELIDEDYYGVWEIGWRLSTALNVDPSHDPEAAASAIASLQRQGRLQIYVREWIDDPPRALDVSGRSIDLSEASAWRAPEAGQPQFLIGAAGDGEDGDG